MDFLLSFYSGKSTLLTTISERDIPIPDHIDIFHLTEEIRASDKTPLQCVMEVDNERYGLFFLFCVSIPIISIVVKDLVLTRIMYVFYTS